MSLLGNEDDKIGNWDSKDLEYRGQNMDPANDCISGTVHVQFPEPLCFLDPFATFF